MDAKDIKPPNKAAKAMVLFITAWFIILSALTCALPKPAMYSDLGNNYVNAITEGLSIDSGDTAWVLVSSCLVLFMTPGVAFFCNLIIIFILIILYYIYHYYHHQNHYFTIHYHYDQSSLS